MCGIAGLVDPSAGADALAQAAARMTDALARRGPDGRGVWCEAGAGIALGHRRLAIIDLSERGAQPMASRDGRWVVTYNGELYDAAAHAPALAAGGHVFAGTSDTEVLVELIARHGVADALARVEGIFAFAAFDRAEGRLWLARDRMGVKPLLYAVAGRRLLFGSELRALLAHPGLARRIDPAALSSLLRHGYVPAPGTLLAGVRKLAPGTLLSWRPGEAAREEAYFSLDAVRRAGEADPFRGDDEAAADALEPLLTGAVRRQMTSDVPLGAFLSGGIDSSLVASLMVGAGGPAPRTFAVAFGEDPRLDEGGHAERIARHLGTRHTTVAVGEAEALARVADLADLSDEPLGDPSLLPTHLVCAAARRDGLTVALSGDGGDELFAGYERYFLAESFSSRVEPVPLALRRAASGAVAALPDRGLALLAATLPARLAGAEPADRLRKAAAVLPLDGFGLYRRLLTLNPDAQALARGVPGLPSPMDSVPEAPTRLDRMRALDCAAYLPDDILAKVDRASMAVGLEARVPLLDRDVVAFAWRLPAARLARGGSGKLPLRTLLARRVPRALWERPKQGFAPPLARWLRGPLRPFARDLVLPADAFGGLIDGPRARAMLEAHLAGSRNHAVGLWPILMFEAWRRRWGLAG
ncbi:Asparagine synthetase [glutamine-hydrolyzing] 1 [Methylobacterium crusticola]|uniref:asparagine synthase (glutamine-hydrolyzing) n=1 Tax=Methylobacterium crusticola TaxID=1697972 RepID=A0ABQ4QRJ6_9HYPH|nr:asparagine synthase (glutamine-hydrolyzing) [Methylobacterium crusticola]GJD47681.1 Asparagine synthetase [glutamine-hydrolyzing] 1 [Methylobacterium crusticola]